MKKAICIVFAALAILPLNAWAGHRGMLFSETNIGVLTPGDQNMEEIDDAVLHLMTELNVPVAENLDVNASLVITDMAGHANGLDYNSSAWSLGVETLYSFNRNQQFNPFLGVGLSYTNFQFTGEAVGFAIKDDGSDTSIDFKGGVEFNYPGWLMMYDFKYSSLERVDGISFGIKVHKYLTPSSSIGLQARFYFDSKDQVTSIGYTLGL